MDVKRLRRRIKGMVGGKSKERVKIVSIVGIAGTTETGSVDNLRDLAKIAADVQTHFHVDACWGGAALLVDEYRPLFKGIEQADSVCIDAHKLLYSPMAMGLVLFRNERDLHAIRYTSNYVIRRNSVDTGRFTVEGSRPFACLKPWAALKIIGRDGYALLLREAHKNTHTLKRILDRSENFETLNHPELFILVYRFVPKAVRDQLGRWREEGNSSGDKENLREAERKVRKVNTLINGLTIKLHKALRTDDTTFVSRTTLESTRYRPQSIVVLRAVLINPLTDEDVVREIVETQNRIGLRIWREFKPAYAKMLREFTGGK